MNELFESYIFIIFKNTPVIDFRFHNTLVRTDVDYDLSLLWFAKIYILA